MFCNFASADCLSDFYLRTSEIALAEFSSRFRPTLRLPPAPIRRCFPDGVLDGSERRRSCWKRCFSVGDVPMRCGPVAFYCRKMRLSSFGTFRPEKKVPSDWGTVAEARNHPTGFVIKIIR